MQRYLSADLHLSHDNIIAFCDRPFANVDEMDEALVTYWNETVTPDDEVFILGDLAMGRIEHSLEVASRLHGRRYLVPGNHDRTWSGGHKGWEKWLDRYADAGFMSAYHHPGDTLKINDVRCCHWPTLGEARPELPDRFSAWRPEPGPLLHGHVHTAWKVRNGQVNVGVDVWGLRPVAWEDAIALLGTEDQ